MREIRDAVSIVIPVANGESVIRKQILALAPQLIIGDELIVVDNRSTDGTRGVVAALINHVPQLCLVSARDRPGVNYARNTGIVASKNPHILMCDADDEVSSGWVGAMSTGLGQFHIVGGVSNVVSTLGEGKGSVGGSSRGLGSIFHHLPYALGANLGVRRSVLEEVGCFDETFVGGHDEVDFCWRAQHAGFSVGLAEQAAISYVQRSDTHSIARQYRNYGRTSIQLWVRHRNRIPPQQVSFRGAVRDVFSGLRSGIKIARDRASEAEARDWGWALGVLEGHVRYRVLRRVPPSRIPTLVGRE